MKFLKIFLPVVYVVLILLLLLMNKDCSREREPEPLIDEPYDEPYVEPYDPTDTIPQPIETTEEDMEEIADLGSGKMRFALRYDFLGDIDLHVITPEGVDINFSNRTDSRSTGRLDHDERPGGDGSKENIYFTNPPEGVYKAYLHHFSKKANPSSVRYECRLIVTKEGHDPQTYTFYLPNKDDRSPNVEVAYP